MSDAPDWAGMRRRLAAMRSAIERGDKMGAAETRKVLAQRARLLAREEMRGETAEATIEFLEFSLGSSRFGLVLDGMREVLSDKDLLALPNVPAFVAGLINLRGHVVSVLDLRALLGFGGKAEGPGKIILLGQEERLLGLHVDRVGAVRSLVAGRIQSSVAALPGRGEAYMIGVAEDRSLLLDGARILADEKIVLKAE